MNSNKQKPLRMLLINGTVYMLTDDYIRNSLNIAREALNKRKQRGIYAIERANMIEMRNEIFSTKEDMSKALAEYFKKGFKVHYISRGGK